MLTEWIIYEPAQGDLPELFWAHAFDEPDRDFTLALYRQLFPTTTFAVREVAWNGMPRAS